MEGVTEPVRIWKFSNPIEAHMAIGALKANGIPALLSEGNPGNTFIGLELTWKPEPALISLSVPPARREEALSILEGMFGQSQKEDNVQGNQ
jgi:hypothetical protein